MSDTVRLFIGIDLPDNVKSRIKALPQLKDDFRSQTHPDDLHITLRSLGDVPAEKLDDIMEALSTMKKRQQFSLRIDGLGYFQKSDKGVLYASLEQNRKLNLLEETITTQMHRLGLAEGGRAFSPHITIARLKDDRSFEEYRRRNEKAVGVSWKVENFHVFRSEDKRIGEQRYTSLASFDLSPH